MPYGIHKFTYQLEVFLRNTKDKRTLNIRKSQPNDAEELIKYLNQIGGESDYITFGGNEFDVNVEDEQKFLENYLHSKNRLHIVGTIDNQIASVLNVDSPQKPRLMHVGELGISVRKEYWNQGIAGHMLDYMFDWAHNNPIIKKLMLRVRHDNEAALKLYHKLGFHYEGRLIKDFYLDGKYFDAIIMGKWLD